nr:winged helix DNA-binding protein [Paenibacillus larvae]
MIGMEENATVSRLMQAFVQFNRASWHSHSVEGSKRSEMMLMFCLRRGVEPGSSGMMVSEISHILRVTSPTVTQLIKGLENKGLVERNMDKTDRRAVRVKLTEQGMEVTRKAREKFANNFKELVDYLGEEDSEQLAVLLNKVFNFFDEKNARRNSIQFRGDDE